jgi:putative ABC transport system permease protein
MNVCHLFIRELRFRPWGALLSVVAMSAVAGSMVGARALLAAHDRQTDVLVGALEKRASERMAAMRNDARIFSKNLGFNLLILPQAQDPAQLYAANRSTHFFAPEAVQRVGAAKLNTLNHILPMLRHRVTWDAMQGDVVLVGIEGEIFIKNPGFQKPIEERIEPGKIHIGDAIRQRLGLAVGDSVALLGESFAVHRILPQSGSVDDISILMNLADAQRLTGLTDKISGILALSCNCAAGDRVPIEQELAPLIDAQVVEFSVRARARQQAREAIGRSTRAELKDIGASRGALRTQLEKFAGIIVALVSGGTVLLLIVLSFTSARERRPEVAMLRTLGLGSGRILALFLGKYALTGLCGGALGGLVGRWAVHVLVGPVALTYPFLFVLVGGAVVLATLAAAVPAAMAARTDPAVILNQE